MVGHFCIGENYGRSTKTFLLAKTLTGRQQRVLDLSLPLPFPNSHQEERLIHLSSYS
jgi:hypothetical protein